MLDEPTNDLDLETLDLLQEVIADYDGTVLIVSHDRDFLDRTVTVTLGLDGSGKVDVVAGGYEDWVRKRSPPTSPASGTAVADGAEGRGAQAMRQQRLSALLDPGLRRGTNCPTRTSATSTGCRARSSGSKREIAADEEALHDPDLFARDPSAVRRADRAHRRPPRRGRRGRACAGSKWRRWRRG